MKNAFNSSAATAALAIIYSPALLAQGVVNMPSAGQTGAPVDELKDIVPPVDIPFWTSENIAAAVGCGLVLLGLCVWGIRAWLNRARPPVPPPDPLQVALEALKRLAASSAEDVSAKEFVFAVADVIRRFLEAKHGLEAPRQTTEEFLEMAERSQRFPEGVRSQLKAFLGRCDEVKFSRVESLSEARETLVQVAFKLVREDLA